MSKKKGAAAAPPAGTLEITVRRGENLNNDGAGWGDRQIDPYVKILPSWLPQHKKASWQRTGTADDAGVVKLFAYPCVVEDAPHRRSVGHASHVMGVAFSPCGNRLLSVGGTDRCVFQYDVVRKPPPPPRAASPEKEWLPMDAKNKTYGWRRPDVPPSELYER